MKAPFQKILSSILAVLLLCAGVVSEKKEKYTYTTYNNISYGTGKYQKMNIYIPTGAAKRSENGAIIFIHGGSWTGGSKDRYFRKDDIAHFAKLGYVTASIDYSLIDFNNFGDVTVFDMLDDITLSISKLKSFAKSKKVNITKLALSGHSAGAHLAMLYSYSRSKKSPVKLAFTAAMAGPSEISPAVWDGTWGENSAYMLLIMLTGVALDEKDVGTAKAQKLMNSVSPTYYINKSSVPSLLCYGGKDKTVPIGNYNAVLSKLKSTGAKYDMVFYPNSGHKLDKDEDCDIRYRHLFEGYCEKYFGY